MPRYVAGYCKHWAATTVHKAWVAYYILRVCLKLVYRAIVHDLSKYSHAESDGFATTIFELKDTEYGTAEYKALLDRIAPSLAHHYSHNTHHPEHWGGRATDMPALDQIEMICDWAAAVRRNKNGDLMKSIQINAKRFEYGSTEEVFYRSLAKELKR